MAGDKRPCNIFKWGREIERVGNNYIERYHTFSMLMPGRYISAPLCPTLYE